MKKLFVLLAMALATCNLLAKSDFVQVKDGHFVRDGKPYYYVGTNFWYGAILGSEGQGGHRIGVRYGNVCCGGSYHGDGAAGTGGAELLDSAIGNHYR